MELVNEAGFPADLSRTQLFYKDLLMAIVVLKASYRVESDGLLRPDAEPIPLREKEQETPYGTLDGDFAPVKEQVDLLVLGRAHAPGGGRTTEMRVELRIGDFRRSIQVAGDRTWDANGVPSAPEPFDSLPLGYARAYGGQARMAEEYEGTYPPNPHGRGFVELEEDVAGTALPNVEEPDEPVRSWRDRPAPAGVAPLPHTSSLRGLRGAKVDQENQSTTLEPTFFNSAHPRMLMEELPLGGDLWLEGMRPDGPWRFQLPRDRFFVEVALGDAVTRLPMRPDTLCLLPEEERLFVLHRRTLVYPFVAEQTRRMRVCAAEPSEELPAGELPRLREAAEDPDHPVELLPMMDDPDELPMPFHEYVARYPLTPIILGLPVCDAGSGGR